jgi:hypothetical protein
MLVDEKKPPKFTLATTLPCVRNRRNAQKDTSDALGYGTHNRRQFFLARLPILGKKTQ